MQDWADGVELEEVAKELKTFVNEISPDTSVTEVRKERYTKLELSTDPGAEYSFSITVHHDLEDLQLAAEPREAMEDPYFWYCPLERADFMTFSEMLEALKSHLKQVLLYPSRIRQTRGWIFWTFTCEVMKERWRPVYSHACLRGMFAVPPIEGKERVFHGPNTAPAVG